MKLVAPLIAAFAFTIQIGTEARGENFRTWQDATGTYTAEAEFVSLKDGKLCLKKRNGAVVTVPIERFSPVDQEYARNQASVTTVSSQEESAKLDYYQLTDKEAVEYAEKHKTMMDVVKKGATGFFLGNLFDNEAGKFIVNDREIQKMDKVAGKYYHHEMVEQDKRVGLLKDYVAAVGEQKMKRIGLVILVGGKPKFVWPKPHASVESEGTGGEGLPLRRKKSQ